MLGKEKFYVKEIKLDEKYKCNISHKNEFMECCQKKRVYFISN